MSTSITTWFTIPEVKDFTSETHFTAPAPRLPADCNFRTISRTSAYTATSYATRVGKRFSSAVQCAALRSLTTSLKIMEKQTTTSKTTGSRSEREQEVCATTTSFIRA